MSEEEKKLRRIVRSLDRQTGGLTPASFVVVNVADLRMLLDWFKDKEFAEA